MLRVLNDIKKELAEQRLLAKERLEESNIDKRSLSRVSDTSAIILYISSNRDVDEALGWNQCIGLLVWGVPIA